MHTARQMARWRRQMERKEARAIDKEGTYYGVFIVMPDDLMLFEDVAYPDMASAHKRCMESAWDGDHTVYEIYRGEVFVRETEIGGRKTYALDSQEARRARCSSGKGDLAYKGFYRYTEKSYSKFDF